MQASYPDLKGKSVFITGGGSGIGASLTKGFLDQGAKVSFVQRSDASAFVDQMEAETGNRPHFIATDIADTDALGAAIDAAASAHGPIDILVNNAATDKRYDTLQISPDEWDSNHSVNLKPYFFAAQKVLPAMQARGAGVILNMSSITYLMGVDNLAPYMTANAGIVGLTRSMAREFGPDGVRVNAIAPGWFLTEKQRREHVTEEGLSAHLARQCLPRELHPEEMIGPVLFLTSNASGAITNQVIAVDGGVVGLG